jgi:tRNA U34 5-carboxymethylaminomethyl modifying enzyme MnmG/GidA
MPVDIQLKLFRSIEGLENVKIVQPGKFFFFFYQIYSLTNRNF